MGDLRVVPWDCLQDSYHMMRHSQEEVEAEEAHAQHGHRTKGSSRPVMSDLDLLKVKGRRGTSCSGGCDVVVVYGGLREAMVDGDCPGSDPAPGPVDLMQVDLSERQEQLDVIILEVSRLVDRTTHAVQR